MDFFYSQSAWTMLHILMKESICQSKILIEFRFFRCSELLSSTKVWYGWILIRCTAKAKGSRVVRYFWLFVCLSNFLEIILNTLLAFISNVYLHAFLLTKVVHFRDVWINLSCAVVHSLKQLFWALFTVSLLHCLSIGLWTK